MLVREGVPLAPLTTLRLGGPAARLVEAGSSAEVVEAVAAADAGGEPVLLLGGGSNLVLADDGWPGLVVLLRNRGVDVARDGDVRRVTAQAGEQWDDLVGRTVAAGWAGLECLPGIPGLTGATPVQNVGAYGQEVSDTVTGVSAYDRQRRLVRELTVAECGFGYRHSVFKTTERYVVLAVTLALRPAEKSGPVRYAELANALGVEVGEVAPLQDVHDAVLALRRAKGMVVDPADPDTWSVGSFFTNPVLDAGRLAVFEERLDPGATYPWWPVGGGRKLSAAWLIEAAGFRKGYGGRSVRLSSKHTLSLTHRGGGTTVELLGLAREVRDGVVDRFSVTLEPEPRLVRVTL